MTAVATTARARAPARTDQHGLPPAERTLPIVAAIDGSAASTAAVEAAVRLGAELDAPVVFVYVRRGPAGFLGEPVYQRRLSAAIEQARRALDHAEHAAALASVVAEGEILEGSPHQRILEFAGHHGARLVVVGRRGRKLGRSVSRAGPVPRRSRSSSPAKERSPGPCASLSTVRTHWWVTRIS
jgi:nucleotide-binding universal stress UspA family protein